MSTETFLACDTCKAFIWIGKIGSLYTGEPEMVAALNDFLSTHKQRHAERPEKHCLRFTDEHDDSIVARSDGGRCNGASYRELQWACDPLGPLGPGGECS